MNEVNSAEPLSDTASTESVVEKAAPAANTEWQVIQVKSRVDSANQDALIDEMRALRLKGCQKIALNLSATRFLSFPALRYIVDASRELAQSGGMVALIACPQRTKRHFEIYGTLNYIHSVRSELELAKLRAFEQ